MTGYLVQGVTDAIGAVPRALTLDRARIAEQTARRFSAERMVTQYLDVYERLLR